MKKPVRIVLWILAAAAAAAGAAAYALTPMRLETVTMRESDAKLTFTEQGVYLYDRNIAVLPQISGEVLEIRVSKGDAVKKGDVLAVVSASDFEHQIKQLESNITGFQAQISNLSVQEQDSRSALAQSRESLAGQIRQLTAAINDYDKNQKSLEKQIEMQENIISENSNLLAVLTQEYRQAREDYDDGIISHTQFTAARTARIQARATLDASMQQLEQMKNAGGSKAGLEAQRESLNSQVILIDRRLAQDNSWAMREYYNSMIEGTKENIGSMNEKLGHASVAAPADGVVTDLPAENANLISASAVAATISSEPVIEVFVPTREIDSVNIGDTVELVLDKRLGSESCAGAVICIEDEATVKISPLGVEERKVRVLVRPQESNLHIGYGMDVKFTVLEQKNSISAPKTAIFEDGGKDFVWLVEAGAVRLREVVKGIETREGFTIASGLKAGDVIVSDANTDGLKEGKRVKAA